MTYTTIGAVNTIKSGQGKTFISPTSYIMETFNLTNILTKMISFSGILSNPLLTMIVPATAR